ncbi:MAG: hypothetical protein EBS09_11780 [Flavobacteriia bacterium]|nr:hypothetical protein [Flavobacteriia bacterium]
MKYTKYYKIWLEDTVEPEGGTWCYMGMDEKGFLRQLNFAYQENEQPDTLEQYVEWGYKIEQL